MAKEYNRYDQCKNCYCYYLNCKGEAKEAVDAAQVECSNEMTYVDEGKKCWCYQPIRGGRRSIIPKLKPMEVK